MPKKEQVGLPPITFLYTLDQIANMINVDLDLFRMRYVHYHMRSTGVKTPKQMYARNIALESDQPDWRVSQDELIRWLRFTGFHVNPFHSRII